MLGKTFMVHFNPINFNPQNKDLKPIEGKEPNNGSIWAAFNDTDKIVDMNDVLYSSADVNSEKIQNFLKKYLGKEYTEKITNKLNQLIQNFNNANNTRVERIYDEETGENTIKVSEYDESGIPILKERIVKKSNDLVYKYEGYNLKSTNLLWPDGSIKESFERVGDYLVKNTVYRKDGTIYSVEVRKTNSSNMKEDSFTKYYDQFLVSEIKYHKDGITPKTEITYDDETNEYTEYRYNKGQIWSILHFDKSMKMKDHIISGGDALKQASEMSIEYDENGQITCYEKRLQDNESDFNEEALNGEFDVPPKQGALGTCYIASPSIALTLTNSGLNILNNAVDYDKTTGIGTVTFQGIGKTYQFTKEEISNAMTRLGYDEPDYVIVALGYEMLKLENGTCVEGGNHKEFLEAILPPDITCDFVGNLFWDYSFVNNVLDELMNDMKEHDFVITASSSDEESINNEWSDDINAERHYITRHVYAIKEITPDSVVVIEPNTHTENKYTREEFFLKFRNLVYAELN